LTEERLVAATGLQFDAEASRRVEAAYLTPDVAEQRRVVLEALALRPGERVVDVGCGPGLLAAEIAAAVGPEGLVCGVDVSASMLALARARASMPGSAPVAFRRAAAARLPCADGSFDVAVSTQVLEYLDDVPAALAEVHRVLRPGGRVLLLDTDWDSIVWHSGDEERMARVLGAWEQHLVDPRLPRKLRGLLERAGFEVAPPRIVPLFNAGFDPASFSVGLVELVAAFVVGRDGLTAEEVDAWASDLRSLGADYLFSLCRYVFCAAKPA
jgi:SAM-dependent methyltransferase